jgi:hypothetical protein
MIHSTPYIPPTSLEVRMLRTLHDALEEKFKGVTEKVVADAKAQFEKELRAALGAAVLNLAHYYTVERMGENLVITVKMEGAK